MIWVHHDALSRDHPVFESGGEAVFVFDPADYERRGWTFKRLVFILECVTEMGVEVVVGDPVEILSGYDHIRTAKTHDAHLKDKIKRLREHAEVEIVPPRPFARVNGEPDLRRFFKYWNKAKRSALDPTT